MYAAAPWRGGRAGAGGAGGGPGAAPGAANLRVRDLLALALSAVAVLITFNVEGNFSVAPALRYELDATLFANGHFPSKEERLPTPVICDLDNDGQNEILIATRDYDLRLLAYQPESEAAAAAHPDRTNVVELARTSLAGNYRVGTRRLAAAMATGFLQLYDPTQARAGGEPRRQRVAVITKGMDVLLFDHRLNLLWEQSLHVDIPQGVYVMEASALIVPASATHPHGLVVVGGRLGRSETPLQRHSEWASPADANAEDGDAAPEAVDPTAVPTEGHFSYYGLDGQTGQVVWKHEEGDFLNQMSGPREQIEYLTEHFKTDARVPVRHRGEQDWRQYRSALIRSALPHRWWDSTDTHLRLAHFEKNRRAGGYGGAGRGGSQRPHNLEGATHKGTVGPTPDHSDVARAIGLENLGELSGGLLFAATDNDNAATTVVARRGLVATGPAAAQQDAAAARYNVLVAHLHDGIEVLQLYSGQPLCRVPLGSDAHGEAVMHADVNGDGVLDHVAAVVGQGQGGLFHARGTVPRVSQCHALARSGIPPLEPLFNGSLCDDAGALDQFLQNAASMMEGGKAADRRKDAAARRNDAAAVETVPPLAVPRLHAGRLPTDSSSPMTYDSVFLVSDGRVTSYSPTGALNWHTVTLATWPSLAERQSQRALSDGAPAAEDGEDAVYAMDLSPRSVFRASLSLMPLHVFGAVTDVYIVAVGWAYMVLLTPQGEIVATLPLRGAPLYPPVLGDFNNDGNTDILLVRRNGRATSIDGFATEHHTGGMLFSSLLYLFLALVVLLVVREIFLPLTAAAGVTFRARATD